MEDVVLRIKSLCELEGLSREELADKTGMKYSRWHNLMNDRGKIKSEEIELVGKAWPEYRLWVAFGDEMPEAGQISPGTKKAREELKTQGKAGA
ncbi:helix-turn-helix transcriptional regulator [Gilvimarinus sp. DA14]|uniref:helix-turn-helix domain-containing protein n=1 Tax=Gilvimarinus sp. DA14 TaxID=2956798 RepID=UPI0020B6DF77|nr:helix-turn-helix transcriptional regulator [Gilvimarinus sp. DA14]UTF61286.1 helix-turn-helix domain-containing protein [Gilvimarinus sp. DA14]